MNVFFGKISPERKDQIDGLFYDAPKEWPGFGGLSDGDYVYMLCKGVVHLWRALPYDEEKKVRSFECILSSIGTCTAFLVHIKYLKLNMDLAVKSHRQTKGMAFFKLDVDPNFTEEMLKSRETYSNSNTFRKVVVRKDEFSCLEDSYDLQFYFESGNLKFKRPLNSDDSYFVDYRDNLGCLGGGRPKKDKVLAMIKDEANRDKFFDYESALDLLRVYDSFMVDYNAKDDSGEIDSANTVEINPQTRFWCFNHTYENCTEEGRKEFIKWAKSHCSCKMQQEYEVEARNGSKQVTPNWKNICAIKENDIVFFRTGGYVYAFGKAIKPRRTSGNSVLKSCRDVIQKKSSGLENSESSYDGFVFFNDAECFYEDFSERTWAQRIDIDKWIGFTSNGFYAKSKDLYEDENVYLTIRELKRNAAKRIIEFFGGKMV